MSLCNHTCYYTCYAFMSLQRLVTSNGGQYYPHDKLSFCRPNRGLIPYGFEYVMLLEERKPGLDEKTIVKLIYVFKNDLPDQ